jgi:hypothetical protein
VESFPFTPQVKFHLVVPLAVFNLIAGGIPPYTLKFSHGFTTTNLVNKGIKLLGFATGNLPYHLCRIDAWTL